MLYGDWLSPDRLELARTRLNTFNAETKNSKGKTAAKYITWNIPEELGEVFATAQVVFAKAESAEIRTKVVDTAVKTAFAVPMGLDRLPPA